MPNHFLTVGLCARDYERLATSGKEDWSDFDFKSLKDANLCELTCPLPEELNGIAATNPRCRYKHKETGEWRKDCNGPDFDEGNQWERVELTAADEYELEAKYGAADWFDWQRKNWGTHWGTYSLKVHQMGGGESPLLIEFQTAWKPLAPEMMRKIDTYLCETYCLQSIKWIGHDPGIGQTVDIKIASVVVADDSDGE